jgi:ZIP family zinc transporter
MTWLEQQAPILQAFLATCFTWFLTAAGSGLVFLFAGISRRVLDGMLGFAAGVMIAASYWSLLAPAIEMAERIGGIAWVPATVGFLLGGAFLFLVDKLLPHLHGGGAPSEAEGIKTSWERSVLLILAITLHNFPEGLAVGVAFGALAADLPAASFAGAVALALGIGIQNFPEGTAVSVPLRREGMSRLKGFLVWAAVGRRRTGGRLAGCSCGDHNAADSALCTGLCGRSDDLCRRGGAHPGITARVDL